MSQICPILANLTKFGPKSDIPVFELVKAIGDVDDSDES